MDKLGVVISKAGRKAEDPDNPRIVRVQVVISVADDAAIKADLGAKESVSSWVYDAIRAKLGRRNRKRR